MGLSSPNSKSGKLQRACLELLEEHEAAGSIPTSNRFLFYELESRGVIPKHYSGSRRPDQDVSEAVLVLRELGIIPWDWIVDETRNLDRWGFGPTAAVHVQDMAAQARIDCWDGTPPPLVLCESRSLSGVLRSIAAEYLAPIASTNGQARGFLETDVGPMIDRNGGFMVDTPVLYFGDLDFSGAHIEENCQRVLGEHGELDWRRLAITDEQVRERGLTVISKYDKRTKSHHDAVETEALSQSVIQDTLRDALDVLLPQPLAEIRELEREEIREIRRLLYKYRRGDLDVDLGE